MNPEQGLVLRLQGTLDDEACSSVRRELAPLLAAGTQHVVLDLGDVTGLGPPAVRMLRSLDRHLAGGLLVVRATPHTASQLRVHELAHLLKLQDLKHPEPRCLGRSQTSPTSSPSSDEPDLPARVCI